MIIVFKQYTSNELIKELGEDTAHFIIDWFNNNKNKTVMELPNGVKIRKPINEIKKPHGKYHIKYDSYMIIFRRKNERR